MIKLHSILQLRGCKCPIARILLNPIFLDWQSNPNPSQICDWQSKSKSDFQNGLTIQSKSNHNPTIFWKKRYRTADINRPSFMMQSWNSQETSYINSHLTDLINCLKILKKCSLASLLEHNPLQNINIVIK